MRCPRCGQPVAGVVFAYEDREGCAECWLAGRASATPGVGPGSGDTGATGARRQRRVWNKGSARTSGPAQTSGTVLVEPGRLRLCRKCGGQWYGGGDVHARHAGPKGWENCIGELLVERGGRWFVDLGTAALPGPGGGNAPEVSD